MHVTVYDASVPYTLSAAIRFEPEPTKGSRFLVAAMPVPSEAVAKDFLATVAADLPDASHHCWAWRLADPFIERAGDDGEPSGSAGRPILAQLTGRELVNVAVVVSRYFGGTKLGVGGLVRAYGGAAGEAFDQSELVGWVPGCERILVHQHADAAIVEHVLQQVGASSLEVTYGESVRRRLALALDQVETLDLLLADRSSGRLCSSDVDGAPG